MGMKGDAQPASKKLILPLLHLMLTQQEYTSGSDHMEQESGRRNGRL
jgi:hypothetical protein